MKAVFVLLVLVAVATAQDPCATVTEEDVCIVSVESGRTCSWCVAQTKTGEEEGMCVSHLLADKLSLIEGMSCDAGHDRVLTRMPVMEPSASLLVPEPEADYIPVVFMHGIGDSGSNAGMQSIAKSVTEKYPGTYSIAVDVADGLSGYTTDIGKQVEEFAATVKKDPKLADGFHAVGLSQGGLIVRIYAQVYNDPPVRNLMSLCGPQSGVGDCPGGTPHFICNLVRERLYDAPVSFAGYWKNVMDKEKYLAENKHLPGWNNEKDTKNQTYVSNLASTTQYVMVEALEDTVVIPHASEQHGFYEWGSMDNIVTFNQTDSYKGDWLGLASMDAKKRVHRYQYKGNHLRWSREFWDGTILPYFADTFADIGVTRRVSRVTPDSSLLPQ